MFPTRWRFASLRDVRNFLNETVLVQWTGGAGPISWPPGSLDLSSLDFFFGGFAKDQVYQPPLPTILQELQHRIIAAVENVEGGALTKVWINGLSSRRVLNDAWGSQ
jgi:hypothetical protein